MQTSRTFIAVAPDGATLAQLQRSTSDLRTRLPDLRWNLPDQMHLTLKFLGDVNVLLLPEVCDRMRKACETVEPFAIEFRGLGTFPKGKPPRIVWAGIAEGLQPLRELHQRLDKQLYDLGIPRENRNFTPHLTLARVGRDADAQLVAESIEQVSQRIALRCEVNEVLLLASIKEQGKLIYDTIDGVELV
jgi:RNA 2',3'-cyclic 3'-phosphodiesterase